jgi:hypothetical protein
MEAIVKTQVWLEPDLHARAKHACRQNDWTLRAFVRRCVREKLAAMEAAKGA